MKADSKTKKEAKISRSREIFGLSVMILGLFLLVGLVSFSGSDSHQWQQEWARANWGGPLGDMLSYGVVHLLGYAGFMLTVLLLIWGWIWLRHKVLGRSMINSLLLLIFTLLCLATLGLLQVPYYTGSLAGGGLFGTFLSDLARNIFGPVGCWLIISGLFLILLLVGTEVNFQHWLNIAVKPVKDGLKKAKDAPKGLTFKKKPAPKVEEPDDSETEDEEPAKTIKQAHSKEQSKFKAEPKLRLTKLGKDYQSRLLALLEDDRDRAEIEEEDKTEILLEKLKEFGIEGEITDRYTGPVVTRYEFKPAPGVKVNQISNLSDDLALAMQAHRIRILAPIPGKGVVGIEIPNTHRKIVMLKDLLLSGNFKTQDGPLTMALGKTITGESFSTDLSEMPHILITGSTGSGKSVCLNTIITSLLYLCTPEDLHFIMIDPKRIELSIYRGIPHLQFQYKVENTGDKPISRTIEGVVTDSQEVVQVFRLAVSEMDARYRVLAKEGCRNISDYNRKSDKKMSYLIIVIDELADLMLSREASEIESRIAKLAQMSRAVGIHLILATQRPSVDVITGVIKANFPARIAFQVASKTDSRTVLDANGAETLLGRGDMLYMPPGKAEPQRLHGPFISTAETEKVVSFIKEWYGVNNEGQDQSAPESQAENNNAEYSMEVALPPEGAGGEDGQDELFEEAKALVVRHQQGSVSLLQRRLKVGYSRAARLIDQLEAAGVVGPFDGSKAREVLIKTQEAD
ncbi:MAG: DNA translocase FtsK [Candidatus Edwardsbacteria bacterium]|nr:DNA translocase FtsK [Candidatus Edwardsbacteria bacterium]MBU1576187.1 DNA translocase FtsK [Candidatus Edwardsbacteria bacterium]